MSRSSLVWNDDGDRKIIAGAGLRVIFAWSEDRWTHALELNGSTIAESLESTGDRAQAAAVVSPAYQEIHPHGVDDPAAGSLCLLLTGRLFDHQFSAVATFSADPERPGGILLDWDAADRCRAPISHLAATYEAALGAGDVVDADSHTISWGGAALLGGRLEFQAGPPEAAALAEGPRGGSRIQAVARVEAAQFTHRLRYRWRWSPASAAEPAATASDRTR